MLGHPVLGAPYRLYTDASDIAIGASLQQIQEILVGDLKDTLSRIVGRQLWMKLQCTFIHDN